MNVPCYLERGLGIPGYCYYLLPYVSDFVIVYLGKEITKVK